MIRENKTLFVGLVGSLWVKLIEWYIQNAMGTMTLSRTIIITQLLFMFIVVMTIIELPKFFIDKDFWKINEIRIAFIPATFYLLKEIYNIIFISKRLFILRFVTIEMILIALPIGFATYLIYERFLEK